MVVTRAHARGQGQSLVGSKDRVETNRQTEPITLPPVLTRFAIKVTKNERHCDFRRSVNLVVVYNAETFVFLISQMILLECWYC